MRTPCFARVSMRLSWVTLLILLYGCNEATPPPPAPDAAKTETETTSYDAESWKTLIADSCLAYFDGCNQCRRNAAGDVAACTRKACLTYKKPYCLDDTE